MIELEVIAVADEEGKRKVLRTVELDKKQAERMLNKNPLGWRLKEGQEVVFKDGSIVPAAKKPKPPKETKNETPKTIEETPSQ